uniref:Uncharacterized protein n=1 Tax=Glossina austeni TaxID=7395 RepID=A0A1A9VLM0_GLOAU
MRTVNSSSSLREEAGRPKNSEQESSNEDDDKDDSVEDESVDKKEPKLYNLRKDEQSRAHRKDILGKGNFEKITMKPTYKQVWAQYPEFDLTEKRISLKPQSKRY